MLRQLGAPTHLVSDVLDVRLHSAGCVRESACPGDELVSTLVAQERCVEPPAQRVLGAADEMLGQCELGVLA